MTSTSASSNRRIKEIMMVYCMIRLTGSMTFDDPGIPNILGIRQCNRAIERMPALHRKQC